MKTKIAFAAVVAATMAAGAAQACAPAHSFDTISAGKLTVALTNTPPYSQETNGAISGIDGDILKRFAEENCLSVTYEIFTYPGAVSAIQSGRADVALGGFYRTAARDRTVRLSTPVYLDQLAIASKEGYDSADQIAELRTGTVEGYDWVLEMEDNFDSTSTYPSSLNLAQDLQAGRIDAALEGYGAAVLLNAGKDIQVKLMQPDERFKATINPTQTSFLLPKENNGLGDAVDASLDAYRADGAIAKALEAYGLHPSGAEVGDARVVE